MLNAVDPTVGVGASTRIILLGSCDISRCESIYLMAKSPFQVLSLTTLRGGFSYHCGSASDTLARSRALAIGLCAPSGDYLIATSPSRHLQEAWQDAGPGRPSHPGDFVGRAVEGAAEHPEYRSATHGRASRAMFSATGQPNVTASIAPNAVRPGCSIG